MTNTLKLKRLYPDAILPKAWTPGSIGLDLHAYCLSEENRRNTLIIPPRTTRNVATGLLVEPPAFHFLMVCSRSGLASRSIWVANAPGIIDPDYRGEIRVLLYNGSLETYYVKHEDRIAQLVVLPAIKTMVIEAKELSPTSRGEEGFGSTGS